MSARFRILRFLIAIPLAAASSLGAMPPAAQAATAVALPDGADGAGTDNDLLAYACPGVIEVFAPAPTRSGLRMSQLELAQIGDFTWELQSNATDGSVDNKADGTRLTSENVRDVGAAMIASMAYVPNTAFTPGSTLQLSLEGSISSGVSDSTSASESYTPTTFDFTVTVATPALVGSGTQADPYLIGDAAELASMRCYEDAYFELENDIALTDKWLPISAHPGSETFWSGHLDGAGYKITGLAVGHPTQRFVGLFGRMAIASVSNLRIEAAAVTGSEYVGVLFGSAASDNNDLTEGDTVNIENVHILNAAVSATTSAGLMGGDYLTDQDGSPEFLPFGDVLRSSASGLLNVRPIVYRSTSGDVKSWDINYIGGMFGDSGEKVNHTSNSVTAIINVTAEHDYNDVLDQLNAAYPNAGLTFAGGQLGVQNLGGYVGHGDFADFQNISVNIDANIEVFGDVLYVGGFGGNVGGTLSHLDIDSDIRVTSLGVIGNPDVSVDELAGGFGSVIGATRTTSFVNIDSAILIEAADGTNNTLNLTYASPAILVRSVGGHSGETGRYFSSDFASRVDTSITIEDQTDARDIGGFTGRLDFDANYGLVNDVVVSGSITIGGSAAADNVAGFVNKRNGGLVGFRNVAAVAITAPNGTTDLGPFGGRFDSPSQSVLFETYWDSTVNALSNPSGYPGEGATTSQLQDAKFLAEAYFDLDNIWELNGGYPELRSGLYGNKTLAPSGSPTVIPAPTTPTPGPAPSPSPSPAPYLGPNSVTVQGTAEPGGTAVAIGERLNMVAGVQVGTQAVNYTVKTNGTLEFEVPQLEAGTYPVTFLAASGGTGRTAQIEIVKPVVIPEKLPAVGKVNVGSFNGKLVVYAQGLDGAKISWRIAGRWQVVTAEGDELNRFDRPVGQAGRNVKVEIFVDGERRLEKTVLTR